MVNILDILKIQRTIRKAIDDYKIESKHGKDALVALIAVDLYLNLTADVTPPASKRKPHPEVMPLGQTTECN